MVSVLRVLLVSAALGSAAAFACLGEWAQAAVPAAAVLAVAVLADVAWRVRAAFRAAGKLLRELPAGGRGGLVRVYTCSRCGEPGVTTWDSEEAAARAAELGVPLVCDRCFTGKLRLAAALTASGPTVAGSPSSP